MEGIVQQITNAVGPKWPQLYSRLDLDYRGRFQITASNQSISPDRVRHHQCALETIQKWQKEPSIQEKDERECIEILLNCVMKIKGLEELALELASQHDITLVSDQHSGPSLSQSSSGGGAGLLNTSIETSSSEVETDPTATAASVLPKEQPPTISIEALIESYKQLWATQINIDQRTHKFALLDVCQRMTANHFKMFCTSLDLDKSVIERIIRQEELPEEQYYCAMKELVCNESNPLTFNDLKNVLQSCSRIDLIGLIINRIIKDSTEH